MISVTYPNGWTLTGHAQQRMDEMGLTAAEVFGAVASPDLRYPGRTGRAGEEREVHVGGELAVVVVSRSAVVVTVLWHGHHQRTLGRPPRDDDPVRPSVLATTQDGGW
jgi:hypothetical protein